jgi:hypothetical protein
MATTTTTTTQQQRGAGRMNAPVRLPDDVAGLLTTFDLALSDLLTTSNPKLAKTTRAGYARAVIHHALPHRALWRAINPETVATTAPRGFVAELRELAERSGMVDAARRHNGCPYATAGCMEACIAGSGFAGLSVGVTFARGRRTLAMVADPVTYARAMLYATAAQMQRAERDALPLAERLNGTDQAPWFARTFPVSPADAERIRRRFGVTVETGERLTMADAFAPERDRLKLYEYCKGTVDAPDGLRAWRDAGWDVTASFAADRSTACRDAVDAVRAGFRVAFPVALSPGAAPLRSVVVETAAGDRVTLPAVDGDLTDARYREPNGVAVVLREKRARGTDRAMVDRFILPDASTVDLADGCVRLIR